MNIAFIVQARSGSTRLPDKMNMPFNGNDTILSIILKRLKQGFKDVPVVVATTTNKKDDAIAETSKRNNVSVFRGSEENVLNRFIEAAKNFSVDHVIRICADNPFINLAFIEQLIERYTNSYSDYLSFKSSENLPAMKTHYGFFAEILSVKALELAAQKTQDPFYCEHVTNFIYGNPDLFSLQFIDMPAEIEKANLRLTVDTAEDFRICQNIYHYLKENNLPVEPKYIVNYVQQQPDMLMTMTQQMNSNKK